MVNTPEGYCEDEQFLKPADPFKVELLVICNNYSDYLAFTLPLNKHHFDNMVVVTGPDDKKTQKLCEYHHVKCVVSKRMFEDGPFNKGKAINDGLAALKGLGWIVHMDADMVLPPATRIIWERIGLDKKLIYGIDRMMCPDFEQWVQFTKEPVLIHENYIYVHSNAFPVGTRICKWGDGDGYIPIGFFQMWHASLKKVYPEEHGYAGRSDMLFAMQWPRAERSFLPEILGIHLSTADLTAAEKMGTNWCGRVSTEFGAPS